MAVTISILRPNLTQVVVGDKVLYFSYETLVAFSTPNSGLIVSQNIWSNTTGRHLSEIDGGSKEAKEARCTSTIWDINLKAFQIDA